MDERVQVEFEDPEEQRRWVFDVTFLTSRWSCIFGQGCQGVLTEAAPELVHGCCTYGAHFTDDDDQARVEKAVAALGDEEWQYAGLARRKGLTVRLRDGSVRTRLVNGACIMLNRVGWPTGPGCALHQAAMVRGERPMDLKPNVCWQLPLRREDMDAPDGWVVSTVGEWQRRHWGDGGAEFHWWCTEAPEAQVGTEPVYKAMRDELVELCGAEVYRLLAAYLDQRTNGTPVSVRRNKHGKKK
jgi:hypothetical protein